MTEVKAPAALPAPEKKIDGVAEAEAKASKERQMVPLEIRVKQFKDMLKEKEVSAFSTWEKELHKIVFDPRYLLLASKERKQVFEKYVKDRAEDERREKRNKLQKKRGEYKALMEEANIHSRYLAAMVVGRNSLLMPIVHFRSSFSDFCSSRHSRDSRFKAIEKMRERENLFSDYIDELRRKEKDEKHQRKEQVREPVNRHDIEAKLNFSLCCLAIDCRKRFAAWNSMLRSVIAFSRPCREAKLFSAPLHAPKLAMTPPEL